MNTDDIEDGFARMQVMRDFLQGEKARLLLAYTDMQVVMWKDCEAHEAPYILRKAVWSDDYCNLLLKGCKPSKGCWCALPSNCVPRGRSCITVTHLAQSLCMPLDNSAVITVQHCDMLCHRSWPRGPCTRLPVSYVCRFDCLPRMSYCPLTMHSSQQPLPHLPGWQADWKY